MALARPNLRVLNAAVTGKIYLGQDQDGYPQYRAATAAEKAESRALTARVARARANIARTGQSGDPFFTAPKKGGLISIAKNLIFLGAGAIAAPVLAGATGLSATAAKTVTGLTLKAATTRAPTKAVSPQSPYVKNATPAAPRRTITMQQLQLALLLFLGGRRNG